MIKYKETFVKVKRTMFEMHFGQSEIETAVRIVRVLTLLFSVGFVIMMVKGGVTQMTSSGRDGAVRDARRGIMVGLVGSFFMLIVFALATVLVANF